MLDYFILSFTKINKNIMKCSKSTENVFKIKIIDPCKKYEMVLKQSQHSFRIVSLGEFHIRYVMEALVYISGKILNETYSVSKIHKR